MSLAQISKEELQARLDEGELVLIDLRDAHEFEAGHIEGAMNIPMGEMKTHLQKLDPDEPTVVYCQRGQRSLSVLAFLMEEDFEDVSSLSGGYDAWVSY